jgi:hypothetical protein
VATITICDVCGSRDNVNRRSYCYDRKLDAAGSMSDVSETYDLCESCELRALRMFFDKIEEPPVYKNEKLIKIISKLRDSNETEYVRMRCKKKKVEVI